MNIIQQSFLLKNLNDTVRFGSILGAKLRPHDVLALIGDLGAGKTTLTQAIAQGMGIAEAVTSPTFTLVQEYGGQTPLFHFDVYRIDADALEDIGFADYLARGGVVLIEWADKVLPLLPAERLTLELTIIEPELHPTGEADDADLPRRVTAEATGDRYITLLDELTAVPEIAAMEERDP
jgi:tRNA threonylcarbamoyladenosine biosynthesis protein TsaE